MMSKHYYLGEDGRFIFRGAADPARYLQRQRAIKKEEAAAARWNAEVGGTLVNGVMVATDRESRATITAAAQVAIRDPAHTIRFKADGVFIALNASEILALSDAVWAHVQACYDREAEIAAAADAAVSLDELDAIDPASGYPSYVEQ